MVKRICTIAWSLTALALAWYMNRGVDLSTDQARSCLRRCGPGIFTGSHARSAGRVPGCAVGRGHEFLRRVHDFLFGPVHRKHLQAADAGLLGIPLPDGGPRGLPVGRGRGYLLCLPGSRRSDGCKNLVQDRSDDGHRLLAWPFLAADHGGWGLGGHPYRLWRLVAVDPDWFVQVLADLPVAESLGLVWQQPGKPVAIYEPWAIVLYSLVALAPASLSAW